MQHAVPLLRAALLNGRYPSRCNMMHNPAPDAGPKSDVVALPRSEATLAEVLRTEGYATGMVGKWHLFRQAAAEIDLSKDMGRDPSSDDETAGRSTINPPSEDYPFTLRRACDSVCGFEGMAIGSAPTAASIAASPIGSPAGTSRSVAAGAAEGFRSGMIL